MAPGNLLFDKNDFCRDLVYDLKSGALGYY